jgi:hypothetical protein
MTDTRTYLSTGAATLVTLLIAVVGVVALVGSIAYWVNGLTQAGADVSVAVQVQRPLAQAWNGPEAGWEPDAVVLPRAGLPDGVRLRVDPRSVELQAWDSTLAEQALARADVLVLGLGVALASWLLRPVLRGLERGEPFRVGSARRIAGIALVIAVVALLAPTLDAVAAAEVLARLDLGDPALVTWTWSLPLVPLVVAALVLAVAESFRRGERLSEDIEGLV